MKQKARPTEDLTQLEHRFKSWRQEQDKKRRIPKPMWQAAVEAARVNGISQVSQTLGLSYTALKGRVPAVPPPVTVSGGPARLPGGDLKKILFFPSVRIRTLYTPGS